MVLQDGHALEDTGVGSNAKICINLEYRGQSEQRQRLNSAGLSLSVNTAAAAAAATASRVPASAALGVRNLAADPGAVLTTSSHWEEGRSARQALPEDDDYENGLVLHDPADVPPTPDDAACWCANSDAPAWWRVEFPAPKFLDFVSWRTHPAPACEGDNPRAFRIQGGNLKTDDLGGKNDNDSDDDDGDIRWTTLARRDDEMSPFGTNCIFKMENDAGKKVAFRFCRIFIERTRNPGNFPVLHRVLISGKPAADA